MAVEGIFRGECKRIKFTPTADIPCGTFVIVGGIVGVTTSAVAAGTEGEIQIDGDYDVKFSTAANVNAGALVRSSVTIPSGTEKTNCPIGVAIEKVTSAKMVRIKLLPFLLWQLAKAFSTAATYAVGDVVINANQFYVCKTAVTSPQSTFPSGSFDLVSAATPSVKLV